MSKTLELICLRAHIPCIVHFICLVNKIKSLKSCIFFKVKISNTVSSAVQVESYFPLGFSYLENPVTLGLLISSKWALSSYQWWSGWWVSHSAQSSSSTAAAWDHRQDPGSQALRHKQEQMPIFSWPQLARITRGPTINYSVQKARLLACQQPSSVNTALLSLSKTQPRGHRNKITVDHSVCQSSVMFMATFKLKKSYAFPIVKLPCVY